MESDLPPARTRRLHRLELAFEGGLVSIAFPAISTGIYGYPIEQAAQVSVRAIADFLVEHTLPGQVVLCTFEDEATRVVESAMAAVRA